MFSHRGSVSRWLAVSFTAAFVVLAGLGVGCSKDDIVGDATAEAVEAGLDDVLASTVDPLFSFLFAIPGIVNSPAVGSSLGGVVCPNTGSLCSGGSAVCTVTGGGTQLTFDFDQCVVVTGDETFTLAGGLILTPGGTSIAVTFNALFINNSPAMSGSGTITIAGCSYTVNISTADDTFVFGTLVLCSTDAYPQNTSFLSIEFGEFFLSISFDGSSTADVIATSGETVVANCDINLAADPLSSSCHAP